MVAQAYIFDTLRTPRGRGKSSGALYEVKPISLLTTVLDALRIRNQLDTAHVDDLVLGCVTPLGEQGGNIAKAGIIAARWDEQVAGFQLNRFCASGLEAVNLAAMKIRSGWEDLVVAGGLESMSRVPMGSDGGPWAQDPQTSSLVSFVPQGIGADLIATLDGLSRQDVDAYAARSQQRAANALSNGYFDKSIVPVKDQNGLLILGKDETIRANTTVEILGQLKPSFAALGGFGFDEVALQKYLEVEKIKHVHTAGNSSGIVDGAALALIGSKQKGQQLGLTPRARIVCAAVTSTEPTIMLKGPAPAAKKALAKAGMLPADIDLFEVNEAFAAVVLHFQRELDISEQKINVNGGAIAMGHPLGATGVMLVGTVLDELERRDLQTALICLCVGGGMGIATIIERV